MQSITKLSYRKHLTWFFACFFFFFALHVKTSVRFKYQNRKDAWVFHQELHLDKYTKCRKQKNAPLPFGETHALEFEHQSRRPYVHKQYLIVSNIFLLTWRGQLYTISFYLMQNWSTSFLYFKQIFAAKKMFISADYTQSMAQFCACT